MTKGEMKAQRKRQKLEEQSAKAHAKAQKDKADALKQENKSTDAAKGKPSAFDPILPAFTADPSAMRLLLPWQEAHLPRGRILTGLFHDCAHGHRSGLIGILGECTGNRNGGNRHAKPIP